MNKNKRTTACIYSASSSKIATEYFEAARSLGEKLGQQSIRIINGAGSTGLMAAVSDGALKAGGEVYGVIPRFMVDEGWQHDKLTRIIQVETMHERKKIMTDLSDGIIALPGGCGTLEELLEIITWKQLGLYVKPIIILNIDHYFDPLFEMFDKAIEKNFMRPIHRNMWQVANSPEEAIDLFLTTPDWDNSLRKIAAI